VKKTEQLLIKLGDSVEGLFNAERTLKPVIEPRLFYEFKAFGCVGSSGTNWPNQHRQF